MKEEKNEGETTVGVRAGRRVEGGRWTGYTFGIHGFIPRVESMQLDRRACTHAWGGVGRRGGGLTHIHAISLARMHANGSKLNQLS